MRDTLNFRSTPVDRPVNWQRLCERVGLESRGKLRQRRKVLFLLQLPANVGILLDKRFATLLFAIQALVAIVPMLLVASI